MPDGLPNLVPDSISGIGHAHQAFLSPCLMKRMGVTLRSENLDAISGAVCHVKEKHGIDEIFERASAHGGSGDSARGAQARGPNNFI